MKILLASHLFFPKHTAGTEVLTLELARSLRKKGHDVFIACCIRHPEIDGNEAPWITQESFDGFTIHQLNFGTHDIRDTVEHHFYSPTRVKLFLGVVEKIKPAIVHFTHINGFSAAAISETKKLGIPVFFTATDYWHICTRSNLYIPHLKKICPGPKGPIDCLLCAQPQTPEWLASMAIAITGDSMANISSTFAKINSTKHRNFQMSRHINEANGIFGSTHFLVDMLCRYGLDREKTKVIPYGVQLGNLPIAINIPDHFDQNSPLIIGFIGSLTAIKGAHVLLEALLLLSEMELAKIRVHIYGNMEPVSPYIQRLESIAEKLGDAVQLKGTFPHDMIGTVLRNMHVCVVPSIWYESAPLVLCSSLAAGTPTIVSKMDGMTEVIEEEVNGISFAVGDSAELAKVLRRLLTITSTLKDLGTVRAAYRTPTDFSDDIEAEYFRALHDQKAAKL